MQDPMTQNEVNSKEGARRQMQIDMDRFLSSGGVVEVVERETRSAGVRLTSYRDHIEAYAAEGVGKREKRNRS